MALHAFFFETPIDDIYIGHQVAEVFKDKVYDKYFVGKSNQVVVDFGGCIGITAYYFSKFAKIVYTLEPEKNNFDVLTHQLTFNNLTNVKPFNLAVSNTDGEATFYHMQNKTMHSLRPAVVDNSQQHETVKTIRLDTFFEQEGIDHVDFMKVDCEGSEADIICGDGFQNIADKIDVLFLELHSWMGRNPEQLKEGLRMAGFTKIDVIPNEAVLWIATKENER